jgi:hypothetical protein
LHRELRADQNHFTDALTEPTVLKLVPTNHGSNLLTQKSHAQDVYTYRKACICIRYGWNVKDLYANLLQNN